MSIQSQAVYQLKIVKRLQAKQSKNTFRAQTVRAYKNIIKIIFNRGE
jgi:hypothetical protein